MKWFILLLLLATDLTSFGQAVSTRIDATMTKVLEDDGILLGTVRDELGMASFLEIDSFFNYIYWD